MFVFFFKQKTAYDMRISDWSSDVCSSDLANPAGARENGTAPPARPGSRRWQEDRQLAKRAAPGILKETAALRRRWKASPDPRPLLNSASVLQEIGRASCRERVCQYV